jgi:hypothetical protein
VLGSALVVSEQGAVSVGASRLAGGLIMLDELAEQAAVVDPHADPVEVGEALGEEGFAFGMPPGEHV